MSMTRAVEASVRVIQLVRANNEDNANHGDGCDAGLQEFGTWDVAGTEFLGAYKTPASGDVVLGSVEQTLQARNEVGLPADLMVVMVDDVWGFVVLDTSQTDQDGENPVLAWNPGLPDRDGMERVDDNFGSFALEECRQALRL